MRAWWCLALVLAALAASGRALDAQVVHGVVLYAEDDTPVAFAVVRLLAADGRVVATEFTTGEGRFQVTVPDAGTYALHVEHTSAYSMVDGPLELGTDFNTFVTFHLRARPIELEGFEVTASPNEWRLQSAGFYERERDGLGYFLDPTDLARRPLVRSSDVFRGVPGVQMVQSSTAGVPSFPLMSFALRGQFWTEGNGSGSPPCFPRVYVDGQLVELGGRSSPPAQSFDHLVPAQDLVGVEVYRSPAEMPAQFGGLTECGVILLWTRAAR
ncbi:MAG: hypothetical protein R3E10_01565 [Gemmatimonadota bacterium]